MLLMALTERRNWKQAEDTAWIERMCLFSTPAHVSQMKGPKQPCIVSCSRELLSEIKGSMMPSLPTASVDSLTASTQLLVTAMDLSYQSSSYATPVSDFITRASASCCLTPPHRISPPSSDTCLIGLGNPLYPNTISDCISKSGHMCDIINQTLIYMIEEKHFNHNSKEIHDTWTPSIFFLNLSHNSFTSDHRASF